MWAPPPLNPSSLTVWSVPWAFLVDQRVKNLPAVQDTWVQPRGWEDPLEKAMDTDSSILV